MSTIVVLKERKNTLVLGTDSRFMKHDFSGAASDSVQKIHEVAPGTFIATSGWAFACDFQVEKARELVGKLGTRDIRVIGEALERETLPRLKELAAALSQIQHLNEAIGRALSGEHTMHGYVLAGRDARGKLGYRKALFRMQDGEPVCLSDEYFGAERHVWVSMADQYRGLVTQDSGMWTDPPVTVVEGILDRLKRAIPTIGGPNQLVAFGRHGAEWISEPPMETRRVEKLAVATATFTSDATFTRGAGNPSLVLAASGMTLYSVAGNTSNPYATLTGTGMAFINGSNKLNLESSAVTIGDFNHSLVALASIATGSSGGTFSIVGTAGDVYLGTGGGAPFLQMGPASNPMLMTMTASSTPNLTIGNYGYVALGYLGYVSIYGTKVLGAQQAGPGNSTDTTDVAGRFNNLLTALRNHGLIT